jgi:membrane protein DedA with SNARE-associated domain
LEDIAESGGQKGIFSLFGNITQEAILLAAQAGYGGIFTLMLLEAAAFPIPSEIVLPFAGYLVSKGALSFWPTVVITTIAALIGSFVDYYLGLRLGALLDPAKVRFVNAEHLRRVDDWFKKYGPIAVALLRLVPAARVLISFPAGAYRMNKAKFAGYTLAGCLPWNFILIYMGWLFGSSWDSVVGLFQYVNVLAYACLILLSIWILLKMKWSRVGSFKFA